MRENIGWGGLDVLRGRNDSESMRVVMEILVEDKRWIDGIEWYEDIDYKDIIDKR